MWHHFYVSPNHMAARQLSEVKIDFPHWVFYAENTLRHKKTDGGFCFKEGFFLTVFLITRFQRQNGGISTSNKHHFLPLSPPGWRGIVVTVQAGGRAGGCQNCGTHISVAAWRIFSIRSSVELSRLVVVHCHGHLPICPIWACSWAKNLSNLAQIGFRLCGTHISETAGWIYPI